MQQLINHFGLSFVELVTGATGRANGLQRYKELPGWSEAAAEVLAEALLPSYAVTAAGDTLVSFPVKRVDASLVSDLGALWLKHAPLDVRKAAHQAVLDAERVRLQEEDKRREAASRSHTVDVAADSRRAVEAMRVRRARK